LTLELHGTQWQSPKFIAIQYHQGNQQIIPTDNHRQRRDGCECGACGSVGSVTADSSVAAGGASVAGAPQAANMKVATSKILKIV